MDTVVVDIADYKILKSEGSITTYALGSCVGICLYDGIHQVAGMSHILLPEISDMAGHKVEEYRKYPETAIPAMLADMLKEGAIKSAITAKIAGGAAMFQTKITAFAIGDRNVAAVRKTLKDLNIPIVAEDVGSSYGRTIELEVKTGQLHIRSMFNGNTII